MTIIGAGYVGSTILYALMLYDIPNEIVLINRNVNKAISEIDDIRHGFKFVGNTVIRVGNFDDISNSDVVVIAIGRNRKPGETRLDLAEDNTRIVKSIIPDLKKYYNNSIIIIVTNPIDIITKIVNDEMNLSYGKVFGTGCILDSSRFVRLLSDYLKCSIEDVRAMVVGEHGDSQVLLWSNVLVNKVRIEEYCKNNNIPWDEGIKELIESRVKNMGASIIKSKGHTQYGVATCTADLVNAVIYDKKILASVSSKMQGEFGINDVCMSYPSIIGENGIIERKVIQPSDSEINNLKLAADKLLKYNYANL